jgi:Icc-related predicted phosphoesterase
VKYQHLVKYLGGKSAGCEELRDCLKRLKKLKLHVFGHIHEGYGKVQVNGVIHVNASIMNDKYYPVNKPIRIVL